MQPLRIPWDEEDLITFGDEDKWYHRVMPLDCPHHSQHWVAASGVVCSSLGGSLYYIDKCTASSPAYDRGGSVVQELLEGGLYYSGTGVGTHVRSSQRCSRRIWRMWVVASWCTGMPRFL